MVVEVSGPRPSPTLVGQGVTVKAEAWIDLVERRTVRGHDGVQPRSGRGRGQMDRCLVDRLLVRGERYDDSAH